MSVRLTATDLGVRFGDRQVLAGLCLELPPGSRLALLGANGSGKTTLLRTLAGALRPQTGDVRVDRQPIGYSRTGLTKHRQTVQLVMQNPDDQLFAADVFRDVSFGPVNLGLPAAEARARVEEALAVLAITDLAERPIHELSFGQRKRVAIAGALAMRPSVVLLDEPTAGLDPQGVDEMTAALAALHERGTSLLISTHEVDYALAWADTVAVLDAGTLTQGAPAAVLGDEALITRARLRAPTVVRVAAGMGVDLAGIRDVATLVAALRSRGDLLE